MATSVQAEPPGGATSAGDHGAAAARDGAPAWPLPRRAIDHLTLDTPAATRLYWTAVALVISGLFVTRLLPCVDYAQHLALSDVARRLSDPAAPEQAAYQLNYFTYNGLFHVLVAWLARVVPIELAGRVVVALSLAGMAGAVLALVKVLRRPPVHAAVHAGHGHLPATICNHSQPFATIRHTRRRTSPCAYAARCLWTGIRVPPCCGCAESR